MPRGGAEGQRRVNEHMLQGWDLALGCLPDREVVAAESLYFPVLVHAIG